MDGVDRNRPIGVFDSGIGGLTVVRELLSRLPAEEIVYFGDSARVPYGSKSPETVLRFTREAVRFLVRRQVKLLVFACNTASAVALPAIERDLELPALGVILPGARAAVRQTKAGVIGVIGTQATVRSGAYVAAIHALRQDARVVQAACPLFVPLAEEGWTLGPVVREIARTYIAPLLEEGIDTLILGCTHYPLLRHTIAETVGPDVTLIDTAEETVVEVASALRARGIERHEDGVTPSHRYYVSDVPAQFGEVGSRFLGRPIHTIERVDQNDLPWYER